MRTWQTARQQFVLLGVDRRIEWYDRFVVDHPYMQKTTARALRLVVVRLNKQSKAALEYKLCKQSVNRIVRKFYQYLIDKRLSYHATK